MEEQLYIHGIPDEVSNGEVAKLRSRLIRDVGKFIQENKLEDLSICVSTHKLDEELVQANELKSSEDSISQRAVQYLSQQPSYKFSNLIVPDQLKENLIAAIDSISVANTVFGVWGLQDVQPNPCTILNFYGPPGTGKTLAAHSIADYLEKPILLMSYADIESKFHGDGPKNLKSIFHAAERDRALLFIDEADSLLSKRLTSINSGSEQAINSMRSQLLVCLEQFKGIAIFATNLVENYDEAFDTRVHHLYFPMPDVTTRLKIWKRHLPQKLPLSQDVSLESLAEIDDICGRDIREAVIDASCRAALRAKRQGKQPEQGLVTNQDFIDAILRKKDTRIKKSARNSTQEIEDSIKSQIKTYAHTNDL